MALLSQIYNAVSNELMSAVCVCVCVFADMCLIQENQPF